MLSSVHLDVTNEIHSIALFTLPVHSISHFSKILKRTPVIVVPALNFFFRCLSEKELS